MSIFERTELLLGSDAMEKLFHARVIVFGVGGVGSYVVEALVRSGVGSLTLVDGDTVSESNINRQLVATLSTVGRAKVDVAAEHARDINPAIRVTASHQFFSAENADAFDFTQYDYAVDAIDTVSSKLLIIEKAKRAGIGVISCMGAGNKLDPARFEVADISKTSVCPLAKVMRRELRVRGIQHVKVVFSKEEPIRRQDPSGGRPVPGSVAFVPSAAGLMIAAEVVKDLTAEAKRT